MKRMDTVDSLLLQLEQYGEEHDRNKKTREEKLRNVSREMGQFLSILVKGCNAKISWKLELLMVILHCG